MGYTTYFTGHVTIDPPLNPEQVRYINAFSGTRRMNRRNGPYYIGKGHSGQDHEPDIIDYNSPPPGQPGLWCQWVVSEDGSRLEWDGGEKFYNATEWLEYLIDHFLGSNPLSVGYDDVPDFGKGLTTEGRILNGEIVADGEESGDHWMIVVVNNRVSEKSGTIVYQ